MLAFVVLALGGASAAALAAPGDLDTSFGSGGKSLVDLGGNEDGYGVTLQPDGKIIVAGERSPAAAGPRDILLVRLLDQGTIDTSFGGGTGASVLDLGGTFDRGEDVVLRPDGKIVVAGPTNRAGNTDFAVAQVLNPQGTFDPSFGGGGFGNLDFAAGGGSSDSAQGVTLQPDGKVILAGYTNANATQDIGVARTTAGGMLDFGYGASGISFTNFGADEYGHDVALQPDGKIIVAGSHYPAGPPNGAFAATRLLNPQGTADPSFGETNGELTVDFGADDEALGMALQPDGKIILAGYTQLLTAPVSEFAVARLDQNGKPDGSFGEDGKITVDFGRVDAAYAAAVQPDGKIIVAGDTGDGFGVARLQPNGILDTTFGTGGKSIADFGVNAEARDMALQPDGKIVVAGYTSAGTGDILIARFLGGSVPGSPGGGPGGGTTVTPKCNGKRATIFGTSGRDNLRGTRRADVIAGLGGRDKLTGLGGNDRICGGSGADRISGGKGKDRLYGNAGNDRISGGASNDRISGGSGKDRLSGGSGRDRLSGGSGRDVLSGGSGKDRCSGRDRKKSC